MDSTIRPATPHDAEFLAQIMLTASRAQLPRGLWDLLTGAGEAACLEYLRRLALTEPRTLCHWEAFLVAEVDGDPAAALCGFDYRESGWMDVGHAMVNVEHSLAWSPEVVAASRARIAWIASCILPNTGADWGIEHVATCPQYRRLGLANRLLEESLRLAAARGCRLAQIATFLGNERAIATYRKAGFRVADEQRSPEVEAALGTPGFVRLLRDLP